MSEILQEILKVGPILVKLEDCAQVYEESSRISIMEIHSFLEHSLIDVWQGHKCASVTSAT